MADAKYSVASDLLDAWYEDIQSGEPPVRFRVHGEALNLFEIAPGFITLLGGPPGVGKTAFTMQCVFNALRLQKGLRVAVCNVEMTPESLLERALAYHSGVPLTSIRDRQIKSEKAQKQLSAGLEILKSVAPRICFVRPPFEIGNALTAAEDFEADLLVVDYMQRIGVKGEEYGSRGQVDAAMAYLRKSALAGLAILAVSAVSRSKGANGGSSYDPDATGLASFRESSELEYGADSAYILVPSDDLGDQVLLKGVKNRHGETRSITMHFQKRIQRFLPLDETAAMDSQPAAQKSRLKQAQELWNAAAQEGGAN